MVKLFNQTRWILGAIAFKKCKSDHSVFVSQEWDFIIIVYIDDILVFDSDMQGIDEAKTWLQQHIGNKDMGCS